MNNLKAKIRDEKWLEAEKEKDPLLMRRKTYYLSGAGIRKGTECHVERCLYATGSSLDQSLSSALQGLTVSSKCYPMMFCFSCNRAYHCVCIGISAEKLKIEPVPWICYECVTNEENDEARGYFATGQWKAGLKWRRKQFMCEEAITEKPALLDVESTDEELDPYDESSLSVILSQTFSQQEKSFGEIGTVPIDVFHKQQKEMEELMEMYKEIANERNSLVDEKNKLQTELEEMRKRMEAMEKKLSDPKPRVRINEQSQIIPPSVLSSTCNTRVLTVKDMLAETYLNQSSSSRSGNGSASTASNANNNAENARDSQEQMESSEITGSENLSMSERILLEQTRVQREAAKLQRESAYTKNLKQVRQALPKIKKFSGDINDWIRFKRDVERYVHVGEYDDYMMRLFVTDALEGLALERVRDVIDKYSIGRTLKILEESFGCPDRIIEKCGHDILSLKLDKDLYRDDVMLVNAKIQAYFSACQYARIDYANTNYLAKHIFDQLNAQNKQFFRSHFRHENNGEPNKLMDLESMYSFLEELAPDLEDKKADDKKEEKSKSRSIMVTTFGNSHSAPRGLDDYMYEIRDKKMAPYIGYDMNAVSSLPKSCESCGKKSHYTVECRNFKNMNNASKLKLVAEKGLCKNCMLTTTHRAINCNVKSCCGFRYGSSRCSQKHHITLHKALTYGNQNGGAGNSNNFHSNNSDVNGSKSNETVNNSSQNGSNVNLQQIQNGGNDNLQTQQNEQQQPQTSVPANQQQLAPSIRQLPEYQRQHIGNSSASNSANITASISSVNPTSTFNVVPYNQQRQGSNMAMFGVKNSVKVFKNKFLGSHGYVVGYSIGDSGSEVTLVRDDLRKALNIEGEPCTLQLHWTDNSIKVFNATRIDLCLQGIMEDAEKLTLKNCYALKDWELPKRSLNMEQLKQQFPHLKDVKFDSYRDVSPWMLIGSPHASLIENAGKLYHDGVGKPVGLQAQLGFSVYGGCPDEYKEAPINTQTIAGEMDLTQESIEGKFNHDIFNLVSLFSCSESPGSKKSPSTWNGNLNGRMMLEAKLKEHPEQRKVFEERLKELRNVLGTLFGSDMKSRLS